MARILFAVLKREVKALLVAGRKAVNVVAGEGRLGEMPARPGKD
jgi:hypothetical protein